MQRRERRQIREQNQHEWNKEGYDMGPFYMQMQLYYCPVTLGKIPCQHTFAGFG